MLNARLLLGLVMVLSSMLPACNTKTSLGREGAQAGREGADTGSGSGAGQDTRPATGCIYAPVSLDLSCNDDPNLPAVAGSCGFDDTCTCSPGFVLNPTSKRCRLDPKSDAGVVICTVGADQTCNDDAWASWVAGTCVGGVACGCKTGYLVNPTTGRCKKAPASDAGSDAAVGQVCTPLLDQTCNDDDLFSGTAGHCGKFICSCNSGFVINPATGRCRASVKPDAGGTPDTWVGKDTVVCYYPSAGDDLSAIKAADEASKSGTNCSLVGCSQGQRYLCCGETAAEPSDSTMYSAAFNAGGYDRISLRKTGTDGYCMTLTLLSPVPTGTSTKPLRVSAPAGWGIEAPVSLSPCRTTGPSDPSTSEQSFGAQGTVTISPNGTSCAMNAHITVFFYAAASGTVTTRRIDADNIPITGGLTSARCK